MLSRVINGPSDRYRLRGGDLSYSYDPLAVGGGSCPELALLMHMDGANGSTTFTDSSDENNTFTVDQTPQISTAQSKFGGASGEFLTTDSISAPAISAYNLSNNDFTIEFWLRKTSASAGVVISIRNINNSADSDSAFQIRSEANGNIDAFVKNASNSIIARVTAGSITLNTWHHVAFVRNGSDFNLYIDGTSVGSDTSSDTVDSVENRLVIGRHQDATQGEFLQGYLDEVRILNGKAAWTSNFTPPAEAYTLEC